jgi:hypothetical protein
LSLSDLGDDLRSAALRAFFLDFVVERAFETCGDTILARLRVLANWNAFHFTSVALWPISWSAIGRKEALDGDSVILTESQALLAGVAGGTPEEDDDISLHTAQLCNSMLVRTMQMEER